MKIKMPLALLVSGLTLCILSLATCQLGVRHEVNKIPAERLAQMGDHDWVGVYWIGLSLAIFAVGVVCLIVGFALRNRVLRGKVSRPSVR